MSAAPLPGRDALLAEIAALQPGPGGVHLSRLCQRLYVVLGVARVRLVLPDGSRFGWPDLSVSRSARTRRIGLRSGEQPVGDLFLDQRLPPGRRQEQLLTELTDLLGSVLQAWPLQTELERSLESARGHAERVAAVRRRAFGERDAERKEIERDLHDGAQHHLVALGMTLGLLEVHAQHGDRAGQQDQLRRLQEGLHRAERSLLATVRGAAPLLQEAGVHTALLADFREMDGQVTLRDEDWDPRRRYEATLELAVYFICLEAVNNARKHAPGSQVVVRLADGPGGLTFSVSDNGPGMVTGAPERQSGLANMRRRIVAAGGRVQVRSAPGAGTVVQAFIPF